MNLTTVFELHHIKRTGFKKVALCVKLFKYFFADFKHLLAYYNHQLHIHGYAIHIAILEFIYMYALTNTCPSIAPS